LQGKLTRRADDQCLHDPGIAFGIDAVHNRNTERRRFSAAGLAKADDILAVENHRDCLRLNRGGNIISDFGNAAFHRIGHLNA